LSDAVLVLTSELQRLVPIATNNHVKSGSWVNCGPADVQLRTQSECERNAIVLHE
jgi:hypothetical protein